MKQELIKPIIKVGNSAGVLLPREWLSGKARIELVEEPLNIKKDILEILEPYLEDIAGIYLTGSYARGEQTERSDVDVLVITNKINKTIQKGKYYLILIEESKLKSRLEENILPLLPMLKEAKTLINEKLLEKYKATKLTKKNLKARIELTKSALNINRTMIDLDKDWPSDCSDVAAYSLTLNLRTVYIIKTLKNNKKYNLREFKNLIKKISGSLKAYEGYIRIKDKEKDKENLPVLEAEKIHDYILKKIGEIEKWLAERKD